MACAHPPSDIVRGLRALNIRHRPTAGSIRQGMHASAVACAHRLGDIDCGLRVMAMRCRPTNGSITQGLHISNVECDPRASDIGQRQLALAKACTHQPCRVRIGWATSASLIAGGIIQGLHSSDVACAHLANDIAQWHTSSAKSYMHQSWHVPIGRATSAIACPHRPGDVV